MKKKLFFRLFLSHLLVTVVSFTILGASVFLLFSRYYFAIQEKELLKKGETLLSLFVHTPNRRLEIPEEIRKLTQGVLITVVTEEEFLRERLLPPQGFMRRMWRALVGNNLPEEVWNNLKKGQPQSWQSFHPTLRQDVLNVAIPLKDERFVPTALVLSTPIASIETTIQTVMYFVWFSSIIALSLSFLTAFFSSSSLTRPIKTMSQTAREMAQGNFQKRIELTDHGEIGELAQNFNILSATLEETIRKLREEKERTENILLHMSEGVLAVDRDYAVVSLNPAFRRALASGNAQVRCLSDLPMSEEITALFEEVFTQKEEREKEIYLPQGKTVIFRVAPLRDQEGVKGAVAVIQDVTEFKRIDRLRREFLANVSHELRTPLTAIQGFLEAVMDEVIPLGEFKEQHLPVLHRETMRLSRLIHDLLDLSVIASGKGTWEMKLIPIASLIERVIAKLAPFTNERGVIVEGDLDPRLEVWGNEDRLEQVFTNLLHNAILFSPPRSHVVMSGERKEDISVIIAIRDQGPGIPPEDLPYIFERFYRVDKSRSRQGGGIGLGLSIAKEIVERHQGKIWVESEMGKGSTFFVSLPGAPSNL